MHAVWSLINQQRDRSILLFAGDCGHVFLGAVEGLRAHESGAVAGAGADDRHGGNNLPRDSSCARAQLGESGGGFALISIEKLTLGPPVFLLLEMAEGGRVLALLFRCRVV